MLLAQRYRADVRALAAELGVSSRLTPVSDELRESNTRDERELPAYAAEIGDQNLDEPYRRKLSFVWRRLQDGTYDELAADLAVVDTNEVEDIVKAGIIDPTMVTRSALQNAASIARNILITEAIVAEPPEKVGAGTAGGMGAWATWAE